MTRGMSGTLGQVAYQAARDERLSRRPSDEVILWGELNRGTQSMWEAAALAVVQNRVNAVSEATDDLIWLSRWIDDSPANALRDPEAKLWGRISKIGEEFGEVIQAMIGATGQNPRKGQTHSMPDVRKELLDVAVTALGAIEHIDGHESMSIQDLLRFVGQVRNRAENVAIHGVGMSYADGAPEITGAGAESRRQAIIDDHHSGRFHGLCVHGENRGECTKGGY